MKSFFFRVFGGLVAYLRESRREMQKVNWPTQGAVGRMTLGVLIFSLTIAFLLGGFDYLFSRALLKIIPHNATTQAPTPHQIPSRHNGGNVPIQVTPQSNTPPPSR